MTTATVTKPTATGIKSVEYTWNADRYTITDSEAGYVVVAKQGAPASTYVVTFAADGLPHACQCASYRWRGGCCKHMQMVEKVADEFGFATPSPESEDDGPAEPDYDPMDAIEREERRLSGW